MEDIINKLGANQPLGVNLNREMTALLIKGLKNLPDAEKKNVLYDTLLQNLETIIVIWDRRIKNEQLILAERRKIKIATKTKTQPVPPISPPQGRAK